MAGEIDDVHGAVGLVGRVGTAAIGKHGHAGGIVSDRNRKRGSECLAVVAVFIQADVDQRDRAAIVVRNDKLLGGRDVLGVDGSRNSGTFAPVKPAAVESGKLGWQVTGLAVLIRVNGVHSSSVLFWLLITVTVSLPRLSTKTPPAVGAGNAIDRALAERNARRDGEAGNLHRIGLANLRDRGGRIVAGYVEGHVLADGIDVLPERPSPTTEIWCRSQPEWRV